MEEGVPQALVRRENLRTLEEDGNIEKHRLRSMANIELLLLMQALAALTKKLVSLKAAAEDNP